MPCLDAVRFDAPEPGDQAALARLGAAAVLIWERLPPGPKEQMIALAPLVVDLLTHQIAKLCCTACCGEHSIGGARCRESCPHAGSLEGHALLLGFGKSNYFACTDRNLARPRPRVHPSCSGRTRYGPHSITSSARARRVGGIVMPRALAVFRLIVSSNRVACSTGRSPGFSPFKIRST